MVVIYLKNYVSKLVFSSLIFLISFFAFGYELISTNLIEWQYVVKTYSVHFFCIFLVLGSTYYIADSIANIIFIWFKKKSVIKKNKECV